MSSISVLIVADHSEATLVFDRGNVSDNAMENLTYSGIHFCGALAANRSYDLLAVPLEQFAEVPGMADVRAYSTTRTLWGSPSAGW